ncbi:MAG: IPT/TIG domain-containing protein [Cyanobacteria bacterium J06635_10]
MASKSNKSWNLETFLDSLIFELDQAQDTLSIKGLNRKLTYMVKDMELELQLFPEFDGEHVSFTTAKPGETGASKISFQLGSIRDTQIREVTKIPVQHGEISIDEVDIPHHEKQHLKKLGIHSTQDLKRTIEEKKVDLGKTTKNKLNYSNLAKVLHKSHRSENPPKVSQASISQAQGKKILTLQGENLAIASSVDQFPAATINNQNVKVISANANELKLEVEDNNIQGKQNQLKVALDPYAVFTMNLES